MSGDSPGSAPPPGPGGLDLSKTLSQTARDARTTAPRNDAESRSSYVDRSGLRRSASFALAFAILAASDTVKAQADERSEPVLAALQLVPTKTCADEATVRRMVEEILERPVFVSGGQAELAVEVRFDSVSGGWEAHLRLSERGELVGERDLVSAEASCGALTGPAALVIALMVDAHRPRLTLRALPPPPPPPPAPVANEASPRKWGMRTAVQARGSYGALPGAALGLGLGSVLRPPAGIPVQVSFTLWPTADSREEGVGGRFRLWHAGLGVCPGWEGGDARLAICSGVQVGQLEGAGVGLSRAEEPRHIWVHAHAVADLGVRLAGPLGVNVSAGIAVPFHRPDFVYTSAEGPVEQVHRPAPVVPIVGIGLEANVSP
jgi:hypothetical protein